MSKLAELPESRALFGEYAQATDFRTLLSRTNDNGPRNDIARMAGARFISAVEVEQGRKLSESTLKQLTGGDTVTARYLYSEYFEYHPQFKLWLAANHKPEISGTDHAMWRRIRLIPFNVRIPDEQQDKHLPETLRAELPGVLVWAVRGCLDWQQQGGLGAPDAVTAATQEYRDEMDTLGQFIEECCCKNDWILEEASMLYKAYQRWSQERGEQPITQRVFGLRLTELGFKAVKKGVMRRKGIELNETWSDKVAGQSQRW
jgi:putative DNA primase/helicase